MGSSPGNAAFLSQASLNPGPYRDQHEPARSWPAQSHDHVESYFECITECSLDDGECVTRCVETLRDST